MTKRPREEEFKTDIQFIKLLIDTNVMTLRPEKNTTFIAAKDDKVIDVWKGLIRHNFLSVPVLQKKKEKYFGFIDMSDIVSYFTKFYGEKTFKTVKNFKELVDTDNSFKEMTVEKMMIHPLSLKNPFIPVKRNYSLYYAAELLARESHMHRVPIVDSDGILVNLLTQSHFLDFIFANLSKIGTKKDKPVDLMKDVFKEVQTIHETELAIDAFNKMSKYNLYGLAVIDQKGVLTGAISVRDLKLIVNDEKMFSKLLGPVSEFIKKLNEEYKDRPKSVISVTKQDKLEKVVQLLHQHKLHRVFITNEKHFVTGVVGVKEIISEVLFD